MDFIIINHHILYSHKGIICQFISQSGRNGGFSIAALLLQRRPKDLRVERFHLSHVSGQAPAPDGTDGSHQRHTFAHASFFLMASLSGST